jgi:hypothetical protein
LLKRVQPRRRREARRLENAPGQQYFYQPQRKSCRILGLKARDAAIVAQIHLNPRAIGQTPLPFGRTVMPPGGTDLLQLQRIDGRPHPGIRPPRVRRRQAEEQRRRCGSAPRPNPRLRDYRWACHRTALLLSQQSTGQPLISVVANGETHGFPRAFGASCP